MSKEDALKKVDEAIANMNNHDPYDQIATTALQLLKVMLEGEVKCSKCDGLGKVNHRVCSDCNMTGKITSPADKIIDEFMKGRG